MIQSKVLKRVVLVFETHMKLDNLQEICELGCSNSLLHNEHIVNCSTMLVKSHNFNDILNGSLKKKIETLKIYQLILTEMKYI